MTGMQLAEKLLDVNTEGFSKRNPSLTNDQAQGIYLNLAREAGHNPVRPLLIDMISKDFPSIKDSHE